MQTTIDRTAADQVTLYYREGNSDKVYQAAIEPAGNDVFVVNFAYGRRGSTMNVGVKVRFKNVDAPYTPGRSASGGTQIKFKAA